MSGPPDVSEVVTIFPMCRQTTFWNGMAVDPMPHGLGKLRKGRASPRVGRAEGVGSPSPKNGP
ncbi:MAG: hypothetical protein RLZZ111_2303 [Planctomycetota bacterium]|jgi:hypothetical protein